MSTGGGSMPYSSLRPLPVGSRKPKNLGDFIARIQADRGFRNVTEASLREEIQARADGQAEQEKQEDVHMAGTSDDADESEEPKDVLAVKAEILRNIDAAHNAAMLSLDFVSLLLTKHNPNQAGTTLSQALREFAGIGTLGASKFEDSEHEADKKRREEKRKESRDISLGWTLMDIDGTREAAEKTSSMLSREIELEAAYWKEVLAVKQNGWSICRLPAERHTLGVRFGFTEASPEFRNNSLAPLRRGEDGSAVLEHSRAGAGSQRLSVAVSRQSELSGQSLPHTSVSDNGPLQTRVLEARNTIFSQELWHELHREAHSLASYGVRASDSSITYEPKLGPRVTLALDTLDVIAPARGDLPDNKLAELTQLSLHLFLSHAHRQNEMQRLRPSPPHIRQLQQFHQYHLLRPIIFQTVHDTSIRQCARFAGELTGLLRLLGMQEASFTISNPQLPTADLVPPSSSSSNRPTAAQALVNLLIAPARFRVDLVLSSTCRVQIRGRTWFLPMTTTQYEIHLLPPSGSQDESFNPLQATFSPSSDRDAYPDFDSVKSYLLSAVPRLLAAEFLAYALSLPSPADPSQKQNQPPTDERGPSAPASWVASVQGNAIQNSNDSAHIRFDLVEKDNHAYHVVVNAAWHVGSEVRRETCRFGGGEKEAVPSVEDIVRAVVTASELP
ncbi:hypothetical protein ACRALDRAFT_1080310 [Sodiomyces alcalophilus JCM 7366]|uniref:uncharacterized protein n=1 Tax=Sodiomyces alcalophilus JCM 7366 TaxID=591952 RepID=UPI0039B5C5D6